MNSDYLTYYAVCEETVPEEVRAKNFQIISDGRADGLHFLRFRACLQSFGKRNRNMRLWTTPIMKAMLGATHVPELLNAGGIPGENGHPIPATGKVTMERIVTIDPNNLSHLIKSMEWSSTNDLLFGVVETLDQGEGTPGNRMMNNILQGMIPSFSLRSLVPQKKNMDGTIDVTGPGRFITYDRVILPSHEEAYMDQSVPVKNIVTQNKFDTCMESFTDLILNSSEKAQRIIDNLQPVYETAAVDPSGVLSIETKKAGRLLIPTESKFRRDIQDFMASI